MTKLAAPPPAAADEVVEIDAMDEWEWEQGQRTPQASDANLAALVRETAKPIAPIVESPPRKTPLVPRGRVTGLVSPQPPRPVETPVTSGAPAETPAPPIEQVTSFAPTPAMGTPIAKPVVAVKPAVPAKPAAPLAGSPRASAVPPSPLRSPPRSPTVPDPASMPSSSRPLSPLRVGVARARSVLTSVDAKPVSVAAPPAPPVSFGARPAPGVPPASMADPMVPPVAQPALEVKPASVADPMVPPVAPPGWPPALDAKPGIAEPVPSGEPPAFDARPGIAEPAALPEARPVLDDVGHRAPSPMPVAASGTPVVLPWPSPFEPWHGPHPLAVADQASPPRPEPGRRRGHRARHATLKTRGLVAVAASRRKALWVGGAAGVVALVALLVLVGGGKPGAVASLAQIEDHAESSAAPAHEAAAAPDVPASPPAQTTAALDTPAVRPPPASSAPANRPGPRPAKQLGGKKLVVEYIERESEVPAPGLVAKAAEDPAIGRARSAYLSGNQKLFTGDAESAILAYRQALALYPGYVGGYRGLGLAYAQLGDTPKALDAFKTYVTAVPNARDIALIRKRIARLQGK